MTHPMARAARHAAAVLTAAAIAACSTATTAGDADGPPADQTANRSADDTLHIPIGTSRTGDGGRISVRFGSVVADSRCPANAYCVWQGDAHIRMVAVSGPHTVAGDLHTSLEPQRQRVGSYTLSLVGLTPYPGTDLPGITTPPVAIVRVVRD